MPGFNSMQRTLVVILLLAAVLAGEARETGVVVLSFISPVTREPVSSYDYRMHKNSGEKRNYPLPLTVLPETPLRYGQEGYAALEHTAAVEHMKRIKAAGFDQVYFDMLPIPDYDPAKELTYLNEPFYYFLNYFEWMKAAEETGLKLGIFADVANQSARYPVYRTITKDEWVKILDGALKLSPDSPAAWKVNGKTALIHFQTDCVYAPKAAPVPGAPMPDGGWREVWRELRAKGHDFFFVADLRPHAGDAAWDDLADAAYLFAPAGPGSFMADYQRDISSRLKKIPYYWTVSSGYYRNGRNYTQPDFQRIRDVYESALSAGAQKVISMTWNDLGEDHDIWPSANKGSELLVVIAYYNRYFKDGKAPGIEVEKLVVAYPLFAPEKVTAKAPVYGNNRWIAPDFTPKVFYWSALKEPKQVEVAGKLLELPAGVSMGEIPLADAGAVSAVLAGEKIALPAVKKIAAEGAEGGLEHRYIDLLKKGAVETVRNPKIPWDFSKNDDSTAERSVSPENGVTMKFKAAAGKHNWVYLRNHMALGQIPCEARFVRLSYKGAFPAGMKLLCILQEEGGVSGSYELGTPPDADRWTTVLLPLAQFKRTSWSRKAPVEIPTAARIRWGHLGAVGTPADGTEGTLSVREFSFVK